MVTSKAWLAFTRAFPEPLMRTLVSWVSNPAACTVPEPLIRMAYCPALPESSILPDPEISVVNELTSSPSKTNFPYPEMRKLQLSLWIRLARAVPEPLMETPLTCTMLTR